MNHINIERKKGYKNKLVAQNFGISLAKNIFQDGLNNPVFSFKWEDNPIQNNTKISELRFCYNRIPNDFYILENIAKEACLIEFNNLKEQYDKSLPIKKFSDNEIYSFIFHASTNDIVQKRKQNNFSAFLLSGGEVIGNDLQTIFKNLYPKDELIKESQDIINLYFSDNRVSTELKEKIKKDIENFWKNFNIKI